MTKAIQRYQVTCKPGYTENFVLTFREARTIAIQFLLSLAPEAAQDAEAFVFDATNYPAVGVIALIRRSIDYSLASHWKKIRDHEGGVVEYRNVANYDPRWDSGTEPRRPNWWDRFDRQFG